MTVGQSSRELEAFIAESNRIEGINRATTEGEIVAHAALLVLRTITVADLEGFVAEIAAVPLRRARGQDVRVGSYFPPPGGPLVEAHLAEILDEAMVGNVTPFETHVAYEKLHPFLDGNGRSGRALWAWQMGRDGYNPFSLPFLHRFYYQSLDGSR
jgi:Fic family protein